MTAGTSGQAWYKFIVSNHSRRQIHSRRTTRVGVECLKLVPANRSTSLAAVRYSMARDPRRVLHNLRLLTDLAALTAMHPHATVHHRSSCYQFPLMPFNRTNLVPRMRDVPAFSARPFASSPACVTSCFTVLSADPPQLLGGVPGSTRVT
jgi:hypothetical protein